MLKGKPKNMEYRDVFGNLHTSKKRILQEIEDIGCKDCNEGLGEFDRRKRYDLVGRLMITKKKIDSLICQKARVCWFKNRDSCTKFYNSSLRWRRLRNKVKGWRLGASGVRNLVRCASKRRGYLRIDLKPRQILESDLMRWSLRSSP